MQTPIDLRAPLIAASLVAISLACAPRDVVVTPQPPPDPGTVVVMVPGTTGTALIEQATGRTLWGSARGLIAPRERGYGLAIPIDGEPDGPAVVAGEAIERLRLGPLKVEVYRPWKRTMAAAGYTVGDSGAPRDEDRFFVVGYDWRRSHVDAARRLGGWLERLADDRGEPLRVVLVTQSSGSFVVRWLAKYGLATLEQAEAGETHPVPGVTIAGMVWVGTANGGAIAVLEEMNDGRRNVPLIGRSWPPEVLFTFPSLYESLPVFAREAFVDRDGTALDVDLFDSAAWPRHGWSIFDERVARRADRAPERFGSREGRRRFVREQLSRSLRLHALLRADPPGWAPPPILSFRFDARPTVERAVLEPRRGGWRTGFGRRAVRVPGDGHASRESRRWLSPAELEAIDERPAEGTHFDMVNDPAVRRQVLRFLAELPQSN